MQAAGPACRSGAFLCSCSGAGWYWCRRSWGFRQETVMPSDGAGPGDAMLRVG
jgi:hypothetical protein